MLIPCFHVYVNPCRLKASYIDIQDDNWTISNLKIKTLNHVRLGFFFLKGGEEELHFPELGNSVLDNNNPDRIVLLIWFNLLSLQGTITLRIRINIKLICRLIKYRDQTVISISTILKFPALNVVFCLNLPGVPHGLTPPLLWTGWRI